MRDNNPPGPAFIENAKYPKNPGDKLPNGAIILDDTEVRRYDHRRDSIILCINPGSYMPFVTWHRVVTSDSPLATGGFTVVDTCAHGDYFQNIEKALPKYADRIEEQMVKLEG